MCSNLTCDIPALVSLAKENGVPIGERFQNGADINETILAPDWHARSLGIKGWFPPISSQS